ncbi:MAG: PEP-utilizing enzyme, partial [Chloroflexota bacterium]
KRSETVIDAAFGLGEALVGGHVEPDHYIIDSIKNKITDKSLGGKAISIIGKVEGGITHQEINGAERQAVSDEVILQLTDIGQQIAELYEFPQDIEWSWVPGNDGSGNQTPQGMGTIHILQSRPITSLFPLPDGLPMEPFRILIGFHTVQGVLEPLTPLGQDVMKSVLVNTGRLFGQSNDIKKQTGILSAAERLWINTTPLLQTKRSRKIYPKVIKAIDPGIAQAMEEIVHDPRLKTKNTMPKIGTVLRVGRFVIPFLGRVIGLLRNPHLRRQEVIQLFDDRVAESNQLLFAKGDLWENYRCHLKLLHSAENIFADTVIPRGVPPVVAGMMTFFGVLERFSKKINQPQLFLEIARGLPHNVTTEMDLALWKTAQTLREDHDSGQAFDEKTAAELADQYKTQTLSPIAQGAVGAFMARYGMRGLGEIDIGRPRWREQPEHIIQTLQSYLKITDPDKAPDAVFMRGAEDALKSAARLESAVGELSFGRLKSRLIRGAVKRYRSLAGMREAPKFFAIRMLGIIRQGLLESNRAFVDAGLLDKPDDLFFLHLHELDQIGLEETISGTFRERIHTRRTLRSREMRRVQIPRVLLSDGTAFYEGVRPTDLDLNSIVGDPVSPGLVEGVVRVIFNPHESQLLPGEILVCPGTDPAWTPLFLAAGGLVMEVGGMMTHGSVVAREYGIPAVVGVHQATTRLKTGQRVRVDGSTGVVEVL